MYMPAQKAKKEESKGRDWLSSGTKRMNPSPMKKEVCKKLIMKAYKIEYMYIRSKCTPSIIQIYCYTWRKKSNTPIIIASAHHNNVIIIMVSGKKVQECIASPFLLQLGQRLRESSRWLHFHLSSLHTSSFFMEEKNSTRRA